MLRPTDIEKLKGKNSRYAVVVALPSAPGEIAEEAEKGGAILTEKPVDLAIAGYSGRRLPADGP